MSFSFIGRATHNCFLSIVAYVLSSAMPAQAAGSIFTSQLGYAPGDPKIAVLAVPTGTFVELSFQVVAATSENVA
jgi:hypothetical protein